MSQINDLVTDIEKFIKDTKKKGRGKNTDKNISNKYKGKEILSLLTENSKFILSNDGEGNTRKVAPSYLEQK